MDKAKAGPGGGGPAVGVQESDTGDSGEESEPTYRHYDNFETDMSLTQDEEDDTVTASVPGPGAREPVTAPSPPRETGLHRVSAVPRDSLPQATTAHGVSSDSDSCTESDTNAFPPRNGHVTDDTTTTSTSESEETQIWVPVSARPSTLTRDDDVTPTQSVTSSNNGSDAQTRPHSLVQKAAAPGSPRVTGSLSVITGPGHDVMTSSEDRRRDSWHALQGNTSSGVQRRLQPPRQVSVGLLRHDEATGTITLDIHGVRNVDSGFGHYDDRERAPPDDAGNQEIPETSAGSMQKSRKPEAEETSLSEQLCTVVSSLYMLLVVVVGVVVPIAEVIAGDPKPVFFEGFYIYLHVLSIAFLLYAYVYLLRAKAIRRPGRTIVTSVSPSQIRKRKTTNSDGMLGQTGSFYLRLGAVFYGIGSMIKSGLHFGEFLQTEATPMCDHVFLGIRPLLHLCFTFFQLYFVFLNSKMLIGRYKLLARFGLMHMVATNVCVWLKNIVMETVSGATNVSLWYGQDYVVIDNITVSIDTSLGGAGRSWSSYGESACHVDTLMGEVVEMSSPYLYPCTIQYSLICGGILLAMWRNLGTSVTKRPSSGDQDRGRNKPSVDCSSSSRGLFLGIIVLVIAVVFLISFFVLTRTRVFLVTATRLQHLGDVTLYVITTLAVIAAFYRMQGLKTASSTSFEETLLVISLVGVYLLGVSNIVAGLMSLDVHGCLLTVLSSCLQIIQGTIQTIFLFNTMKRRACKQEQLYAKRGREFVTFLLICNIALWVMNIFECERLNANPIQLMFFGPVAWNIITKVSIPLAIFFRFHSTVCLANIWKHTWISVQT